MRRRLRRMRQVDPVGAAHRFGRKLGLFGGVSLGLLLVVLTALVVIDDAGSPEQLDALAAHFEQRGRAPGALVAAEARARRLVILGDVAGVERARRTAADIVEALARGSGLDAVALEVPASLQARVDRYLASDPEDTSPLLSAPALLGANPGSAHGLLPVYRRVWALNQELGAARRIRVVAAGAEDWPPRQAASPAAIARRYAARADTILERVHAAVLEREPRARVLFLVDGYDALEDVEARMSAGGGGGLTMRWLAGHARDRYGADVLSVLQDAGRRAGGSGLPVAPAFNGTRFHDLLRTTLPDRSTVAAPVTDVFDFVRDPLLLRSGSGIDLLIVPDGYRLQHATDIYVFLGED